ncbi:uncharacterized protein RCC_05189 [Ramularia collo-cygni]|uniref:Phospholipase/carboxylesterase/thioesterase domain-containing protein n=1 Tax=Ramularia collo-cygni TaxID=112498 RepID=A0A2D3USR5_9PEZI|nr:uncharacterized protein RCC_05189 [Ramularia collo-cygni]CZT19341.1 uncharacterized protein RCC_05189 [Ramularia collo-cygni]
MATQSPEQKTLPSYPEPFIVSAREEHRQTLILLHGRGGTGEQFGTSFIISPISSCPGGGASHSSQILATALPNTKFIFPTARKRHARWYDNGALLHQWFDGVPIDFQDAGMSPEQRDWQLEGLKESCAFLEGIVREEVERVGARNVFVGGLSQGCAMGLQFLLSYEGELGGFVGMSGWLPYVDEMEGVLVEEEKGNDEDDSFARSGSEDRGTALKGEPAAMKICGFVRDNLDLPLPVTSRQPSWLQTPVYLGHGNIDEKVKLAKGRRAAEFLRGMGVQVVWKEYDEGHWYKVPEEIDDIVSFLRSYISLN